MSFIDTSTAFGARAEQRLKDERGITIVLITHEPQVAEYGSRIIRFKVGIVVSDQPNTVRRAAASELQEL